MGHWCCAVQALHGIDGTGFWHTSHLTFYLSEQLLNSNEDLRFAPEPPARHHRICFAIAECLGCKPAGHILGRLKGKWPRGSTLSFVRFRLCSGPSCVSSWIVLTHWLCFMCRYSKFHHPQLWFWGQTRSNSWVSSRWFDVVKAWMQKLDRSEIAKRTTKQHQNLWSTYLDLIGSQARTIVQSIYHVRYLMAELKNPELATACRLASVLWPELNWATNIVTESKWRIYIDRVLTATLHVTEMKSQRSFVSKFSFERQAGQTMLDLAKPFLEWQRSQTMLSFQPSQLENLNLRWACGAFELTELLKHWA